MSRIGNYIREKKWLYRVVHFLYAPIRGVKEYIRKLCKRVRDYNVLKQKKQGRNCVLYMCVPVHNNLGDLAQKLCILEWIHEYYSGYNCIQVPTATLKDEKYINMLKKLVNGNDRIIFQSGYTTHDIHPDHPMHKKVVELFPKTPILFMPQTVNFVSEDEARNTGEKYAKHPHLLFLARDFKSFHTAKRYFGGTKVLAFPDIVTSLIGQNIVKGGVREGVLICVRNDLEKFYTDEQISELGDRLRKEGLSVELTDTEIEFADIRNDNVLKSQILKKIESFSRYKVIITDRYHGTIFSLIAGTPVVIIKTNDHKVITGAQWFENVYPNYVYVANNLNEAFVMAKQCVKHFEYNGMQPYFQGTYYAKLQGEYENNDIKDF